MTPLTAKTGKERRTEPRYPIDVPGVLRSPRDGAVAVRVLDRSTSGLRVSLPCRIPQGAEVEIEFDHAALLGQVRHCQCIGAAAFNLGIWVPHRAEEAPVDLELRRWDLAP